jgi:hypothetical protein
MQNDCYCFKEGGSFRFVMFDLGQLLGHLNQNRNKIGVVVIISMGYDRLQIHMPPQCCPASSLLWSFSVKQKHWKGVRRTLLNDLGRG